MKKEQNILKRELKNTLGLGIGSMAGMSAIGSMANVPGMPAQVTQVTGSVSTGIGLINIGQLAKTGLALGEVVASESKKKGKTGDKHIDRII